MNDGGPAFPQPDTYHPNGQVQYGTPGMTLRDYFAAKAMQALVRDEPATSPFGALAKVSYQVADAMLTARKKGGA